MPSTPNGASNRNQRSPLLHRFNGILQRFFNVQLRPTYYRFLDIYIKRFIDGFLYWLGPVLILLASGIILGLTYTLYTVILPLRCPGRNLVCVKGVLHGSFLGFIVFNVIFNYMLCVGTTNTGEKYDALVRELADATGFVYPENDEEVSNAKREYEDKILERRRARAMEQSAPPSSTATSTTNPRSVKRSNLSSLRNRSSNSVGHSMGQGPYGWMLLGAHEWGFCMKTHQPKPPRSHYDHVTGALIVNMDHYCPWMFNAVGYFNYRYFCNFLLYVITGMGYGAILMYRPFMNSSNHLYSENIKLSKEQGFDSIQHIIPLVPTPSEKISIAFSFMMCLSVGFAVFFLFTMHIYLVLSAQTTIEYHANLQKKRFVRRRGITWINPYDLGMKRNWQQVYGTCHPLLALLPSRREPEFLPVPLAGERGRRHCKALMSSSSSHASLSGSANDDIESVPLVPRADIVEV